MNVERLSSLDGFLKIKDRWNDFLFSSDLNCIFLTHEWFFSWARSFSFDDSLEILVFKDDEEKLLGLAPLMREGKNLCFLASQEVTDYCDLISHKERREEFYADFLSYFRMNFPIGTRIELINIRSPSPSLSFIPRLALEYEIICSIQESEVAPTLALQPSYEAYVSGLNRKDRHELRRKLKRLGSLAGIRTETVTDTNKLRSAIDDFIGLHSRSSLEKKKFWEKEGMPGFFKELVNQFSLNKWVELHLMYAEQELLAALLNFSYMDGIYFYNVAYNPDYSWYSPGLYLFDQSIKQAIFEKKKRADFLRGRERYKYYFGAQDSKIHSLTLKTGENKE